MYVSKITLANVRQFELRKFEFGPGFNLLVGENGVGKSTLIRALLVLFSNTKKARRWAALHMEDIRLHSSELSISAEVCTANGELIGSPTYRQSLRSRATRTNSFTELPVIFYGSNEALCRQLRGRRTKFHSGSNSEIEEDNEVWIYRGISKRFDQNSNPSSFGRSEDIYKFVGDVLSKFSPAFRGFDWVFAPYACSLKIKRGKARNLDTDFGSHEAIEEAIMRHFQETENPFEFIDKNSIDIDANGNIIGFENKGPVAPPLKDFIAQLGISKKYLFYLADLSIKVHLSPRIRVIKNSKDGFESLLLKQLSDGEQRLFSLFVDIARQLTLLSKTGHVTKTPALILIDEIDVHLHPKWQRLIVPTLEDLFPICQFIATTHSPFVIQAAREEKVQHLDHELLGGFADRGIEEIAVKVMGIDDPEVSVRYLEMLSAAKNYFMALEETERSDAIAVSKLKLHLDDLSRRFAWNPAYQAFLELRRDAKLGTRNEQ